MPATTASTTTSTTQRDSAILARRAAQVQRGAARAAVLGVNDGLVSVLCIVLGVAAAHGSQSGVLLAGFAGLVAGAVSMAMGEWISVTSQVELFRGILSDLKRMVQDDKALLVEQLRHDFTSKGLAAQTTTTAAAETAGNDETLYLQYANNVMGVNPDELGSPMTAAISSLVLFTAGAIVSLTPWFFIGGNRAVVLSIVFTSLGGLVVGGYIGITSGNNIYRSALRQLIIIALASVVTYGIGHAFGMIVH